MSPVMVRNRLAAKGRDKVPSRLLRPVPPITRGAHASDEGTEPRVVVQGGELQGLLEVLGVLLAGDDGLLDIVKGGGVVAVAGSYARERREGGGVVGVDSDSPQEELFRRLELIGRVVEARVGVEGAGIGRVGFL